MPSMSAIMKKGTGDHLEIFSGRCLLNSSIKNALLVKQPPYAIHNF